MGSSRGIPFQYIFESVLDVEACLFHDQFGQFLRLKQFLYYDLYGLLFSHSGKPSCTLNDYT